MCDIVVLHTKTPIFISCFHYLMIRIVSLWNCIYFISFSQVGLNLSTCILLISHFILHWQPFSFFKTTSGSESIQRSHAVMSFSLQELGMMTPQQARRRRMMPSRPEDTISTCGTSARKMAQRPVTQSASPTLTHPRWIQSGMSTQDSSEPCSSASQVSVCRGAKTVMHFVSY